MTAIISKKPVKKDPPVKRLGKKNSTLDDLFVDCYRSLKLFCQVILPERFFTPFNSLHDDLFAILDDRTIQKSVTVAPRGFGKTTIYTIADPLRDILYSDAAFIVPVSSSSTSAVLQAENLKRELFTNVDIKRLFGDMKTNKVSQEQWLCNNKNKTMVFPRGSGQQVRGILYGSTRPDRITCDDLEDPEQVRSEERRKNMLEWFIADVCGAVDRVRDTYRIKVIGTILHEDALLANLLDDPHWTHLHLSLCDEAYNTNWPDFMSTEKVKDLVEQFRSLGRLDSFYREYMNIPIALEDAVFKPAYFKYYEESDISDKIHETIVIVDPAKTVKKHSDYSAIVGITLTDDGVFIRDLINERLHPDEITRKTLDMANRLNASVIGLEVTSLNEFITYPFYEQMLRSGHHYNVVELKARGKKEDRIAALAPLYRQGIIKHKKGLCDVLEGQLMSFPRSKYDDAMDCLAYLVEMLDIGSRFFPSYNGGYSVQKTEEEAYKELAKTYEPALEGWELAI